MGVCVGKEKAPAQTQNEEQYHHIFKIVILGDVSVGKSCILLRYLQNVFTETVATIGEDLQGSFVIATKYLFSIFLPTSHVLLSHNILATYVFLHIRYRAALNIIIQAHNRPFFIFLRFIAFY